MTEINAHAAEFLPDRAAASPRYHALVRWTHWLMAACFVFMWASGYAMRNLMTQDSAAQEWLYDLHKSVGVTLIALLVIRLGARAWTALPPLPRRLAPAERRVAKAAHWALYGLVVLGLATGWALTDFGGHGVVWFGVAMPQVFPIREQLLGVTLDPLASTIHAWLTYLLLALVVLHVVAVVKHVVVDRVNLLPRMAIWNQSSVKEAAE